MYSGGVGIPVSSTDGKSSKLLPCNTNLGNSDIHGSPMDVHIYPLAPVRLFIVGQNTRDIQMATPSLSWEHARMALVIYMDHPWMSTYTP